MLFKWMIMESRIKITHFNKKFISNLDNIVWKSFASYICICFSYFYHSQALFFFDNQEWKNNLKNIIQKFTGCIPSIYGSFVCLFACISISLFFTSSKKIVQPICKTFISTGNSEFTMPLRAISISSLFNFSKIKTSFSVDNTCKVCDLGVFLSCCKWNFLSHISPFIYHYTMLNEYSIIIHRERLSVLDLERDMRQSDPLTKAVEANPKRFARLEIGQKSNRMVLNEAAQRLGVSLRQTEDQLMRDMLASTASFINCTNGVNGDNPTEITRPDVDTVVRTLRGNNAYSFLSGVEGENKFGKLCAEVKPWVIDLEFLAA